MSYSEADKKIKLSKIFKSYTGSYRVEGEDYLVDCPHAIMKTNVDPEHQLVQILDVMGHATILDIGDQKV